MIINYPKPGTFTVGLKLAAVQQPPIQFGNRMFTYESRHDENHNKNLHFRSETATTRTLGGGRVCA
jgi:hypothetical protein